MRKIRYLHRSKMGSFLSGAATLSFDAHVERWILSSAMNGREEDRAEIARDVARVERNLKAHIYGRERAATD